MKYVSYLICFYSLFTLTSFHLPDDKIVTYTYTSDELTVCADKIPNLFLLAKLAFAESGILSEESIKATISTILTRVEHPKFPNTIKDVVYQRGQFDAINHKNWSIPFDTTKYLKLAKEVYLDDNREKWLYFFNPDISTDTEFVRWGLSRKGRDIDQHYYFN